MHSTACRCLLLSLFPLFPMSAQERPARPLPQAPNLQQVTRRAGMIFAGTVSSIAPIRATGQQQVESVEISVQVEQAIRGVRVGQILTIREWAGLWPSGERYRIGERLVPFLHSPSSIGLTSPVGGSAGRYAIDRDGRVLLNRVRQRMAPDSRLGMDDVRQIGLHDFTRAVRRLRVPEGRLKLSCQARATGVWGSSPLLLRPLIHPVIHRLVPKL